MDVNPTMLCMGCMNPLPEADAVCPHCGYDNAHAENLPHQLPPRTILAGKYLVGRALGQGGFGVTYIGWDLNLEIRVAIKEYYPEGFVTRGQTGAATVLPFTGPKEDAYREGCERFVREAKVIAKFSELPSIVHVRDYFKENGTAYIVMEFVDGETMQQYAARMGGKLPAQEILARFRPLLRSLAEVHESGLLHRDISPDNIMIRENGSVKLLDFGAARQVSAMGEHSNTINVKHGYAPEEQYRTHGQQGPWTDVYALCATIYKLATGVTPAQAMDRAMSNLPLVPPNSLGAAFTPRQQSALLHGLAIRGSDRTADMAALERELYGAGASEATAQQHPPQQTQRSAPFTQQQPTWQQPQQQPARQPAATQAAKPRAARKWPWIAAAAAFLCFLHIQINLNVALACYEMADYPAADRHLKLSLVGGTLYPADKPLMEAGLLIEDGRYDEAIELLDTLGDSYVYDYADAAKLEALYRKAGTLVKSGGYVDAKALYTQLDDYKDSKALLTDTTLLQGDALLKDRRFSDALKLFKALNADGADGAQKKIDQTYYEWGAYLQTQNDPLTAYQKLKQANDYSDASSRMSALQEPIYQRGITAYRESRISDAATYFAAISGYARSRDYLTLIALKQESPGRFGKSDLWDRLVPLIGFEDAGSMIFDLGNGWAGIWFMEGRFSASPYYIKIYQERGNWYGTWNLPNVSLDTWHFDGGQFFVNDVARFYIEALSKNSVRITHATNGAVYLLTRD